MKQLIICLILSLGFVSGALADPAPASTVKVAGVEPLQIDLQGADVVPPTAVDRSPWDSTIMFYAFGLVGMGSHYIKKWARGQYAGNLWDYLFTNNPRASLAAVLTYTAAAAGVISTGSIDGMTLAQVAALGFGTGYVSDSAVNAT